MFEFIFEAYEVSKKTLQYFQKRKVKPEPLKLLLFLNLNQLADICTNKSHAVVELKLFLHKNGKCWVCSDSLAGGCLC